MTVLCVNSSVVYADITAADAAESGINYGTETIFEQSGVSSSSVVFSGSDYLNGVIYRASSGEETTGVITVGAICSGNITSSARIAIEKLRTGLINIGDFGGPENTGSALLNLVSDGSISSDVYILNQLVAQSVTNCITHNCSEGIRLIATNDNCIVTNHTSVNCSGFGVLRPRAANSVSLDTGNSAYLQIGASSSNYWADDGTGSNAITEGTSTDIFEDYAGGDYRIKPTSSPGIAGAGAFINVSSGISIAVTLGTIEYNSNNTAIVLAGTVDVTATLGAINYSSNDAVIQVSGDVNVIATLGAINYASNDAVISLFGNVDVTATLGTIDYNSNDASVSLLGGINVNATLGAIDYVSSDTTITLQGQVALITTLGTISYDSNNVIVQIGTGQIIGNVTAGFADNLYSAGFKPSEITVNFKT